MTMGERIAQARRKKGYTQEYVAQMLDISRQAVHKWEKDLSSPDTKNLISLSQLLGVTVDHLVVGEPKENDGPSPVRVLRWGSIVLLFLSLALYLLGILSGEFNRHGMIPVSDTLEVGIPFVYYGRSDASVLILIFMIMSFALSILMGVIGWVIGKRK